MYQVVYQLLMMTFTRPWPQGQIMIDLIFCYRFLSTAKGGHLTDSDGNVIQKWKWPMGSVKLGTPVSMQVHVWNISTENTET